MATKRERDFRSGVRQRLERLIAEAGGAAEFCRRSWPDDRYAAETNKAKVSKWRQTGGIDPAQAAEVARAFGYRAGWLLFGELPERDEVSRGLREISDDVRDEVLQRTATQRAKLPAWASHVVESQLTGEALLDALTQIALTEYVDNVTWLRNTIDLYESISELEEVATMHDIDVSHALQRLEGLLQAAQLNQPESLTIQWGRRLSIKDIDDLRREAEGQGALF